MEITRFAPSPTGRLHLGHARSALFASESAKGGTFLLRIEDIDPTRCRDEYIAGIEEDLSWLGLTWPKPALRQSEHMAYYRAALERLEADDLIYPCFCTRKHIADEIARLGAAPHGPEGLPYPGLCRTLSASERTRKREEGTPYAWRLNIDKALNRTKTPLSWHDREKGLQHVTSETLAPLGDPVLGRKETPASYHLCVTLDDARQGVTLVTRGEDLFFATPLHRLLQALLDLPTPDYHHHALLMDAQGNRLSKRDNAITLQALRESGMTPEDIRARVTLRSS